MTLQYIAILLSVTLCVAVLAIVLLCVLAGWMMEKERRAERAVKDAQGEINMLGNRLARKNHWDFQIKEKAASGTNTDGKQGNITTYIINEKGGEVND